MCQSNGQRRFWVSDRWVWNKTENERAITVGDSDGSLFNDGYSNSSLVSVVIPVYNSANHVSGCIDNIRKQSYTNVETIFVVDSKCSDGTFEKIIELSRCMNNVKVIEQKDDKRCGGARNIGLDAANGEYVWFMDVDDYPHPDFISELIGIIVDYGCEIVACNHYYSHDSEPIIPPEKEYKRMEMTGHEAMEKVCEGVIAIPSWNKIYKRSFLMDIGLRFTSDYSEDYYYTMNSFIKAKKVVYYNKPLYTYVLNDGTRSVGAGDEIARADIRETMKVAECLNEDEYERFCAKSFRHILRSMTNTSSKAFKELSRTNEMRMLSKCEQESFSLEVTIYRICPYLYFIIGRTARRLKFSKKNLLFDSNI